MYSFLLDGEPLEDTSVVIPVGEQDEEHIFTSYVTGASWVRPTNYVLRIAHAQTVVLTAINGETGKNLPSSAKVTMTVTDEDGAEWWANDTRSAALKYAGSKVYSLPAGIYTYRISAQNEAGTKLWKEVTGTFVVTDESQSITVELPLYNRGPFAVAVNVTKDGAPVKGVKLTVNGETQDIFDGTTELKLYTGRKYIYTVEAPGCRTVSGTFDVLGEARTLDIAMESSPGAIAGKTVTVYVSLMDGDKYMTDAKGDIYRRPVTVSTPISASIICPATTTIMSMIR